MMISDFLFFPRGKIVEKTIKFFMEDSQFFFEELNAEILPQYFSEEQIVIYKENFDDYFTKEYKSKVDQSVVEVVKVDKDSLGVKNNEAKSFLMDFELSNIVAILRRNTIVKDKIWFSHEKPMDELELENLVSRLIE